jgi:hypothetical protein
MTAGHPTRLRQEVAFGFRLLIAVEVVYWSAHGHRRPSRLRRHQAISKIDLVLGSMHLVFHGEQ